MKPSQMPDVAGAFRIRRMLRQKLSEQDKTCPDGTSYRRCIAWRVHGGCGHACFDMCSPEQRSACKEQHTQDKANTEAQRPAPAGTLTPLVGGLNQEGNR